MNNNISIRLNVLSALLVVLAFVIDLSLPVGVAGGIPYIALPLLGIWSPTKWQAYRLATICTALAIIAHFMSSPGNEPWAAFANHILTFIMLWVTAFIVCKHKQLKKESALTQQRLSSHLKNTPLAAILWNEDFECIEWNDAAERIFGFSKDEAIGKNALQFIVPEKIHDQIDIIFSELINQKGGNHSINENITKDGRTIVCEWFNTPLIGEDGVSLGFASMAQDITALRANERELLVQKRALDEHALVVVTDRTGAILYVNDKFCTVSGYTRQELIGGNPRLLKSGFHTKDYYKDMWETITSGNIWHGEVCNKAKDGSLYWLQTTIAPLTDETGDINQFIAIRTDVTDRKHTEDQLRQTHKMNAVGQLTGGIAHDFNNILGIIMGNLEILETMIENDPKALKRIKTASKGAKRGAELTSKLLNFSRTSSSKTELISINESIEKMEGLIKKTLTSSIRIENKLAADIWTVDLNQGDLEDALLNLAINARDAMPDGGTLLIETQNTVLDKQHTELCPESKVGEHVLISVSDTGTGMSMQVMEKVLEPFFSTKSSGLGTGLGLSMIHGFIKRTGGHMDIHSEMGKGSTFKLYIPRAKSCEVIIDDVSAPQTKEALPFSQDTLPHGNEIILVVDDEKDLAKLAKIQLSQLGYAVIVTSNANEAVTILRSDQHIDLLFSDVVMPGRIDGYKLSLTALSLRPTIKILLTSGFTGRREDYLDETDVELLKLSETLLAKPYSFSDLAKAVRNTLDAADI